jgi:hypothetical protein
MQRLLYIVSAGVALASGGSTGDPAPEPGGLEAAAAKETASSPDAFRPGEVWLDVEGQPINAHAGGVLYEDGTYYWYGQHMEGETWAPEANRAWGGTRVDVVGVSCYSSRDLLNWKSEGIVLPAVPDDPAHDLHTSKVVERPKVVRNDRTGKYVMWMHIDSEDYSYARAGVAVSDSPTGPFEYLGSLRPHGHMSRDMTLFKDDDGRAYLFFSSENNVTLHVALLSDDYLEPTPEWKRLFVDRSREAPAVFKHEGRYFIVSSGCTGWDPNPAEYAVADTIMGDWEVKGSPCTGEGCDVTFHSQSTFVLPVAPGRFIFMADRWRPADLPDSRYVWLPLRIDGDSLSIEWKDEWRLDPRAGPPPSP